MKANLLLALVASLSAAPAQEVNTFTAHLTGAAVVPPSATPVAGKGTFYLTGNGLGSHLFILHLGSTPRGAEQK